MIHASVGSLVVSQRAAREGIEWKRRALVPPRSRTTPPEASCRELDGRTED